MPFKAIMLAAAVAICVAAVIVAQTETEQGPAPRGETYAAALPGPDARPDAPPAAPTGLRTYRGGRR